MSQTRVFPSRRAERPATKRHGVSRIAVLVSLMVVTIAAPLTGFVGSDMSFNLPGRAIVAQTATSAAGLGNGSQAAATDLTGGDTALSVARVRSAPLTGCGVETAANGERKIGSGNKLYYPIYAGHYQITSPYGMRISPIGGGLEMHTGVDMAKDFGEPVYSIADGEVIFVGWWGGNAIKLKHELPDGSVFYTFYTHLLDNTTRFKEGDRVDAGEQIAEMGSSGYSTGPHTHLEIHENKIGNHTDPIAWLKKHGAVHINEKCS